jgi:hypothetical protein
VPAGPDLTANFPEVRTDIACRKIPSTYNNKSYNDYIGSYPGMVQYSQWVGALFTSTAHPECYRPPSKDTTGTASFLTTPDGLSGKTYILCKKVRLITSLTAADDAMMVVTGVEMKGGGERSVGLPPCSAGYETINPTGAGSPVLDCSAVKPAVDAGEKWVAGTSLTVLGKSAACKFKLQMQGDGNLVASNNGVAYWSTGTHGHPGAYALMQSGDGNFVVYGPGGAALWWTGAGGAGATLRLDASGNVILYTKWSGRAWPLPPLGDVGPAGCEFDVGCSGQLNFCAKKELLSQ